MIKAYKYRLYPNKEQAHLMQKHFGCVRFLYNKGLETKIKEYQTNNKTLSCHDLINNMLKQLKKDNEWLQEVNSQSLQMSLRNLDNAYTNFFRNKKGFPKFKSKHDNKHSFQCPQHCKINFDDNKITIPKIKNIKAKLHRKFDDDSSTIKTVTISKTCSGKYFASILVDDGVELPKKYKLEKKKAIGIDLGLKDYLVTSNGLRVQNPKHLKKQQKKLSYLQYRFSKTKKESSNRERLRIKLAKQHERVANCRNDFLHKLTHQLVVCDS